MSNFGLPSVKGYDRKLRKTVIQTSTYSSDLSQNFEGCISGSNLRPCGDGSRCYHRLDSCWEAACLNADCFEDHVLISDSITELDKTQVNVTTVFDYMYRRALVIVGSMGSSEPMNFWKILNLTYYS